MSDSLFDENMSLLHSDEETRSPHRQTQGANIINGDDDYNFEPEFLDFPNIPLEDCTDTEASDGERLLGDGKGRLEVTNRSKPVVIKRRIGLIHAVALFVGNIIGSGIFISPIFVLKNCGSVGLTMIVWTIGGLVSLLGALCYCELGTLIEKSGGNFIYLKIAYGRLPAFLYSWLSVWFMDPASFAIKALTFSLYFSKLFDVSCENTLLLKLLAAISICIFTFINCLSVRWSARVQVIFTGAKLVGISAIVVVGLSQLVTGNTQHFQNSFANTVTDVGMVGHAFYSVMWAYDGWANLNDITEELVEPEKNFPRCMLVSIPLITVCYVLMNISYITVLSTEEILTSSAVAFTFAEKLSPVFGIIMPLIVAVSIFGSINSQVFSASRVLFSIAREKQMPDFLSLVNRNSQTPIPAILFRALLGLLMLLPSSIEPLLNCMVFIQWLVFLATFTAVLLLRWRKPNLPRPYKVFVLTPIIMIIIALLFAATPFIINPLESVFGLAVLAAGIPVYFVFVVKKWTPKIVSKFLAKTYYLSHLLCNVVIPANPRTALHH